MRGFLPPQSAYADLFVVDALWSDFEMGHFRDALHWYSGQDVTMGGYVRPSSPRERPSRSSVYPKRAPVEGSGRRACSRHPARTAAGRHDRMPNDTGRAEPEARASYHDLSSGAAIIDHEQLGWVGRPAIPGNRAGTSGAGRRQRTCRSPVEKEKSTTPARLRRPLARPAPPAVRAADSAPSGPRAPRRPPLPSRWTLRALPRPGRGRPCSRRR